MIPHRIAALFPVLDGEELQALADDIKAHGQREPILIHDGQLIDGRNRLRACQLAGVEPRFEEYAGHPANIPALIISKNLHRRHLSTDQRAAIAAELVTTRLGDNQHGTNSEAPNGGSPIEGGSNDPPSKPKIDTAAAAELLGVGTATVKRAKHRKRTDPEAHKAAIRGDRPKRTRKPEPKAAPPPREHGTYTNGQGFVMHYEAPPRGATKVDVAFLRNAPADDVVDWLEGVLDPARLAALRAVVNGRAAQAPAVAAEIAEVPVAAGVAGAPAAAPAKTSPREDAVDLHTRARALLDDVAPSSADDSEASAE